MKQGDTLTVELMSPNCSFKDGRDGPVHRLSFEVHEEDWNAFKHADKKGMIINAEMTVAESNEGAASGPIENGTSSMVEACEDPRPVKKRRMNATEIEAIELCRNPDFQEYIHEERDRNYEQSEAGARQFILYYCGVSHRFEIEQRRIPAMAFGKLVDDFERAK